MIINNVSMVIFHFVLECCIASLDQVPFLVILIPAKNPGPDLVQSVMYRTHENSVETISL